jgi:four helix bundle protein
MTSQIRRSAISIAANIAEGYGRDSSGACTNFLRFAQGSLKELETHLIIAGRVGLSERDEVDRFIQKCDELGKMLRSLIPSIERTSGKNK